MRFNEFMLIINARAKCTFEFFVIIRNENQKQHISAIRNKIGYINVTDVLPRTLKGITVTEIHDSIYGIR